MALPVLNKIFRYLELYIIRINYNILYMTKQIFCPQKIENNTYNLG